VRVIATGIDSLESITSKYRDSPFILKRLAELGEDLLSVSIHHCVNAILASNECRPPGIPAANHVIFNHPHLGTENSALHGRFLCHLFDSVSRAWLHPNGSFYLALASGQYERWSCAEAAQRHGFRLNRRHDFCGPSVKDPYFQYRRHQTGKSFASRVFASEIFTFVRCETLDDSALQLGWYNICLPVDSFCSSSIQKNHIQQTETCFACSLCHKTFREERSVRNHVKLKHNSRKKGQEDLECDECRPRHVKVFESALALQDHKQAKHQAMHKLIRPDWCDPCRQEASESNSTFGCCEICSAGFADQSSKMIHLQEFVPSVFGVASSPCSGTYKCCFCNKNFLQRRAWQQHENCCATKNSSQSTNVGS
jgi:hypothetical protein